MNYPDDNYDAVHDAIIDSKRPEYETWKEREQQVGCDSHKLSIIRSNIKRLENFVAKL